MIIGQCQNIAEGNLGELNDLLLNTLMTFNTFDIPTNWGLNRTPSQLERAHSQVSAGAREASGVDQIMQEDGAQGSSLAAAGTVAIVPSLSGAKKMTQEQEDQFKQLLAQFKTDSSPLMHILTLYNYFFTKFTEEKSKLERQGEVVKQKIKELEEQQNEASTEKKEDGDKKNDDATAAKSVPDEEITKEVTELKKRLDGCQASLSQKESFLENIKAFFRTEKIAMLVMQISKILRIIQQTNIELIESAKNIVNCVFDCFMTEMYDEVVKGIKQRESKLAAAHSAKDKKEASKEDEESKYVSMEPIQKIASEADNGPPVQESAAEMEASSLVADANK